MLFGYTNRDVDMLDGVLRQVRAERGEFGETHSFETKPGAAEFAIGDRVQFGSKTIRPRSASYTSRAPAIQQ